MPGFLPLLAVGGGILTPPPVFRSVGATGVGTTATGLGMPAGFIGNDLLIIVIAGTSSSTPTGYSTTNTGTTGLVVYYKIAVGNETTPTLSLSSSTSDAVILCYTNTKTSSPINVQDISDNTSTGTTLSTRSITTLTANELVLSIFAAGSPNVTLTEPASTTARVHISGVNRNLIIAEEQQAAASATTVRSSTAGSSITWFAFSLAITTT